MGSLNPVVDFGQRSAFLFFVAFQELNLEVSSVKSMGRSPCRTSKSSCWYDERYDFSVVVVVGSGGVVCIAILVIFMIGFW